MLPVGQQLRQTSVVSARTRERELAKSVGTFTYLRHSYLCTAIKALGLKSVSPARSNASPRSECQFGRRRGERS